MLRAAPLLALGVLGCTSAPSVVTTCGFDGIDGTVLILENSAGFDTAALARLAGGCLEEQPADIVLGRDQTLLSARGRPYLGLNGEGTLVSLDPATLELGRRIELYRGALAAPAGAHGIYGVDADDDGALWVSRTDAGSVAVVKPDGTVVGAVDLSDLDPDGIPDMNGVLVRGDRAYVALDLLDLEGAVNNVVRPRRKGLLAVLDTKTRTRIGVIDLIGSNPVHALVPTDATAREIVVATPGVFDEQDADAEAGADGIDRVDLETGTVTQVLREDELGGSVSELVWGSEHEAYAIVLGPVPSVNPSRLVAIDPAQRTVRELAAADSFVHSGLTLTERYVLVGDRTPDHPRLLAFRRGAGDPPLEIPTSVLAPFALLGLGP